MRNGSWAGPPRGERAPRVGISSTVFGGSPRTRCSARCVLGFFFGLGFEDAGLRCRVSRFGMGSIWLAMVARAIARPSSDLIGFELIFNGSGLFWIGRRPRFDPRPGVDLILLVGDFIFCMCRC